MPSCLTVQEGKRKGSFISFKNPNNLLAKGLDSDSFDIKMFFVNILINVWLNLTTVKSQKAFVNPITLKSRDSLKFAQDSWLSPLGFTCFSPTINLVALTGCKVKKILD